MCIRDRAYVALGANLGDARQTVLWAISQFDGLADVELVARSHLSVSYTHLDVYKRQLTHCSCGM